MQKSISKFDCIHASDVEPKQNVFEKSLRGEDTRFHPISNGKPEASRANAGRRGDLRGEVLEGAREIARVAAARGLLSVTRLHEI